MSTPISAPLAPVAGPESGWELVVHDVTDVADGVRAIALRHPDGVALPPWAPGAHLDVTVGEFERQYSLYGDVDDAATWRIAVLREPKSRGGSSFVHVSLAVGHRVRVRGPRNHFTLDSAADFVFIAGGIGITPILPMLAQVSRAGSPWVLHYGGRTASSMAFVEQLVDAYGTHVSIHPQDQVGHMDLAEILKDVTSETLVYCCGPEPLLRAVEQQIALTPAELRLERFAPKPQDDTPAGSFAIELAESGLTLTVPPELSVLDVVRAAGVDVLSSCAEGTCGTCETEVIAGQVDHRDSILTQKERDANNVMFVCCSRARSDTLVLRL
jgi:ferredoxin-NADP reductase